MTALVDLLTGTLLRATETAAGFDLFATSDCYIRAGQTVLVPTGVRTRMNPGIVGLIRDRSGRASRNEPIVVAGVIDSDYADEWKVCLRNTSYNDYMVEKDSRIAQVLFLPVVTTVTAVGDATVTIGEKRSGGFGSTG